MNLVFDSSALIAYLKDETGGEATDNLLADTNNSCFVHASNLCEVYYETRRVGGEDRAQAALALLRRAGLVAREDLDEEFWLNAGQIKADYRRVSLADCFCITLANRLDAEAITGDRHELERLTKAGVFRARFIR